MSCVKLIADQSKRVEAIASVKILKNIKIICGLNIWDLKDDTKQQVDADQLQHSNRLIATNF